MKAFPSRLGSLSVAAWLGALTLAADDACSSTPSRLSLTDGPYQNWLYSDCHSSSHVVVTSPRPEDDPKVISPRLLIAWPAGNSGIALLFSPDKGDQNGPLTIRLDNHTTGNALEPIYIPANSGNPQVGISGLINFASPAVLPISILGSIRAIREYTEGSKTLHPEMQDKVSASEADNGGAKLERTWFDEVTKTSLIFSPVNGAKQVTIDQKNLSFGAGTYQFNASFNYPQLKQLSPEKVLNQQSQGLIQQNPDQTKSLSFLSYTDKLLAGTWRFLTYFGRDSMLSLLLLQPILSEGEDGAIEAIIGAAIERINQTDGTVCHEEVLGDYSSFINLQKNIKSSDPQCDYKMVDTDFFLPIVMKNYFIDTETGKNRAAAFLQKNASFLKDNKGHSYADLAQKTAEKIMKAAARFADKQEKENLIHILEGEKVGNWRDSGDGLGGGKIPYDVNTALVPAALYAISALSDAGIFKKEWKDDARKYGEVWEGKTLDFFKVSWPKDRAQERLNAYLKHMTIEKPKEVQSDVTYYGLALDGSNDLPVVDVMNSDDCFRHFLLDMKDQQQLSSFMSQSADIILAPYPIGLSSGAGLFVANPAFTGDLYWKMFTREAYHGTVVWGWQMAMMAAGLARQLKRCSSSAPDWCKSDETYSKVRSAYYHLWDLIDKNRDYLSNEVWSWGGPVEDMHAVPLGTYVPLESNIRQLWSLAFLALKKEEFRENIS